jgi:hypothetical protein
LKDIKIDKLSRRVISKLETRLMSTYQIDASACPNVTSERYIKNLRYLVGRRYAEHSIDYEPWQELIQDCLEQDASLTDELFTMLASYGDAKEIVIWLRKLSIDPNTLPVHVGVC